MNTGVQEVNLFGAFTFGSLIKTFLPGFVWLIALDLLGADYLMLTGRPAPGLIPVTDAMAALLAVPAAILLGLLSNIVVFMGINDWLVRSPVQREKPELWQLYKTVCQRVRDAYWTRLDSAGDRELRPPRSAFDDCVDAELLILTKLDVTKLAYVREQYWYYLEFQVNLVLSLAVLLLALAVRTLTAAAPCTWWLADLAVTGTPIAVLCVVLVKSARKNYARHVAKMITLLVSILPDTVSDASNGATESG